MFPQGSLSQLSIKTRIETMKRRSSPSQSNVVWVSYPLKQGLKPHNTPLTTIVIVSLSQLSIKTRIETGTGCLNSIPDIVVWVSYPLKQGLKPTGGDIIYALSFVWVSYPLKQGLKHNNPSLLEKKPVGLSQLSIKTRIETPVGRGCREADHLFESAIH